MKRIVITSIIIVFLLVGDLPAQRRGGGGGGRGGGGFSGASRGGGGYSGGARAGGGNYSHSPSMSRAAPTNSARSYSPQMQNRGAMNSQSFSRDPIRKPSDRCRKPGEYIQGRYGKSFGSQTRAAIGTCRFAITQLVSTTKPWPTGQLSKWLVFSVQPFR